MSRQDLFERVLASLNAAALDDALWPAASGLIDEFCGAKGNMLVTGDGATQEDVDIFFARFCFRGERHADLEREYFEVWHAVDERLPRIRRLSDGRLAPVPSLFGEDELKTSALYNELMPRTDTGTASACVSTERTVRASSGPSPLRLGQTAGRRPGSRRSRVFCSICGSSSG